MVSSCVGHRARQCLCTRFALSGTAKGGPTREIGGTACRTRNARRNLSSGPFAHGSGHLPTAGWAVGALRTRFPNRILAFQGSLDLGVESGIDGWVGRVICTTPVDDRPTPNRRRQANHVAEADTHPGAHSSGCLLWPHEHRYGHHMGCLTDPDAREPFACSSVSVRNLGMAGPVADRDHQPAAGTGEGPRRRITYVVPLGGLQSLPLRTSIARVVVGVAASDGADPCDQGNSEPRCTAEIRPLPHRPQNAQRTSGASRHSCVSDAHDLPGSSDPSAPIVPHELGRDAPGARIDVLGSRLGGWWRGEA